MPMHIQRRMKDLREIFLKSARTRPFFPLSITKKCLKWATLRRIFWLVSEKKGMCRRRNFDTQQTLGSFRYY